MINREKLRNLKIIVADLDGSLLKNDATIGAKTKNLIIELQSLGVLFSFASGRLHSALIQYARELNIKVPLISLDGSLIKSFPENNLIFESFVHKKYVKKALYYADKYLLNIALCHADAIYYTEPNSIIPVLLDKFGARYEEVSSYDALYENTLEITIASDFRDNIKHVREVMSFPYSFGLSVSFFKSQRKNGVYYLELRRKGADKRKALYKLLNHLGIDHSEAAVIGDWYNDISLFKTDALKIAVENSVSEVKKLADFITQKSNNDEGVAEFLELVLKSKKGHLH
jgi:Cof subfamily protein (haloacid dehalogenase superfamily)